MTVSLNQVQYDRLKMLCARTLGTINKYVELKSIDDLGGGRLKVKALYRKSFPYQMIYDGERIIECARLIC